MSRLEPELYKKLIDGDDDADLESVVVDVEAVYPQKPSRSSKKETLTKIRSSGVVSCCCKCILITLALTTVVAFVVSLGTYVWMKDVVQHLTVTTPHDRFPVVDMTEAEVSVVKDRVTLFVDELRAGKTIDKPLVVTQDEINGLLCQSDFLRGNIMVTIQQDNIQEDYSLPTWMLPGGKGRFFVAQEHLVVDQAKDTVEIEMDTAAKHQDWFDGPLWLAQLNYVVKNNKDSARMFELYLEHGTFFGQSAPEEFIAKHQNLLEFLYEDDDCEDARAVVEGIERVSIEPGKITIYPRRRD